MEINLARRRSTKAEEEESNSLERSVYLCKIPKRKDWTIVWSMCASLMTIPFGLMLGWPSPVYPRLLKPTSPIVINMDQSAMITGFLMIGNLLGTPFSTKSFCGPKYGIVFSLGLMAAGWFVMWKARDFYWLLGSRLMIGFGNGYGIGQLKIYIKQICEANVSALLLKQINLYLFCGQLLIFVFGPFVGFRDISIISLITTIFIFFLTIFLPSSHENQMKEDKIENRNNVSLKFQENINDLMNKRKCIRYTLMNCHFVRLVKNKVLRNHFFILLFLIFCQQFSGAPATLVYTQILFEKSRSPYPIYFAILYAAIFFVANVIGIFVAPKYNKKFVLLLSSFAVSLATVAKICIVYFKVNENYWNYGSVLVMCLYIIVHTVGLGNIPFTLISDFFPSDYHNFITIISVMFHSALAIIITKIFQVLITKFDLCVSFCLFLCTSLICFVFVLICFPKSKESENS